jgi:hypothetical protein
MRFRTALACLSLIACHRASVRERAQARLGGELPDRDLHVTFSSVGSSLGSAPDELFVRFDGASEDFAHFCARLGLRERPVRFNIAAVPPPWWIAGGQRRGCAKLRPDQSPVEAVLEQGHIYLWVGTPPPVPVFP